MFCSFDDETNQENTSGHKRPHYTNQETSSQVIKLTSFIKILLIIYI